MKRRTLGATSKGKARLLLSVSQLHRATRFLDAQNSHQPHVQGIAANDTFDQFFFIDFALAIFIGTVVLLRQLLAVIYQKLRMPFQPWQEVFPPHPQPRVDEAVQVTFITEGQMSALLPSRRRRNAKITSAYAACENRLLPTSSNQ